MFTDDDLKRCKRLLAGEMSMQRHVLNNPEVEALLARLEAAERLCGSLKESHSEEAKAWRKTKGEGNLPPPLEPEK